MISKAPKALSIVVEAIRASSNRVAVMAISRIVCTRWSAEVTFLQNQVDK